MTIPSRIRGHIKVLNDLGLEVASYCTTGSSHYRIDVTFKGKKRFFIVAYSPSDRRSAMNWKSDVKRWMRQIEMS